MLISLILAWLSVLLAALTAAKYLVRKYGGPKLNRAFSRGHRKLGWALLAAGLLHGVFAGNPAGTALGGMTAAPELFELNWGTACFIAVLLLALTYVFRKRLKRLWLPAHRALTALLVCLVVAHVADVGIAVDDRIAEALGGSHAAGEAAAESDAAEAEQAGFSGAVLRDGAYEGSAEGFNGPIRVSVTVSGGQVTGISVLDENETERYFNRALSVLDEIKDGQTLEVDTVSGATFSSAGLVNAVYDALKGAVESGELVAAQIDLSGVRRH